MSKSKTTLVLPQLPSPVAIRREIDALKSRIGELRVMLPLAEVQSLKRLLAVIPLAKAPTGRKAKRIRDTENANR